MQNPLKTYFRRILNLKLYLKDPNQSTAKKILIIFGIIYLLSPENLLPEPIFGIGILDDLILWGVILTYLAQELDTYTGGEGISRSARKQYRGTKIYETEARVVEEEDESSEGEKEK